MTVVFTSSSVLLKVMLIHFLILELRRFIHGAPESDISR